MDDGPDFWQQQEMLEHEQWECYQEFLKDDMEFQAWLNSLNANCENEEIEHGTYSERHGRR